ncbi:acyltransferase family protein [Gryllotalpicola ginsengisoli]|uniref:acyltransferase family protein n=1 Tax=Gryllotalpicola ginsengisoli TaxID=444608 RepID=UPI0003B6277C|nr:acyltransferase family protein [Gryllotalpicola ginsengisoli]
MQYEQAPTTARPTAPTTPSPAPRAAGTTGARSDRFRPDIQGLRAIAVAAVVVYHGGVQVISGGYVGVDMFFVISGFLITTHLLRDVLATGKVDFAGFYARRARRILPASFAVVILTLAAAFLFIPPAQIKQAADDAIWTVFYVPNMAFAERGTNYLAQTDAPSLFQHYWSLGVEEQFYLLWPLLLVIFFFIARRSRLALGFFLAAVGAVSLWLCVQWTPTANSWAYFSLPARAWEFMAGGLIALLLSSGIALPKFLGALLGWAGIAGIAWTVLTYTDSTSFPGTAAIVPVAATAAVILGGARPAVYGPFGLLGIAPMRWVGEISYSLYLVHWPLLTIAQAAVGSSHPISLTWRVVMMVACVPLAWLLYHFIENPIRRSRSFANAGAAPALMGAVIMSFVLVLAATGLSSYAARAPQTADKAAATLTDVGVQEHPKGTDYVPKNLTPSLADASNDNPVVYSDGCHLEQDGTTPKSCVFGTDKSAPRVVLFGDSHAAQWFPALDTLAEKGEISLQVETKSGCPAASLDVLFKEGERVVTYPECNEWRDAVLRKLADNPPAAVIISELTDATKADGQDATATDWENGLEETLNKLPAGAKKLVLGDTPFPGQAPTDCLSGNLTDASACDLPLSAAASDKLEKSLKTAATAGSAEYLSPTPYLCNTADCPAIIGNVLVYRDGSHLTATFAKSLAPLFEARLSDLIGASAAGS